MLVRAATGDEEIGGVGDSNVHAIILGHDLPHLSHLGKEGLTHTHTHTHSDGWHMGLLTLCVCVCAVCVRSACAAGGCGVCDV